MLKDTIEMEMIGEGRDRELAGMMACMTGGSLKCQISLDSLQHSLSTSASISNPSCAPKPWMNSRRCILNAACETRLSHTAWRQTQQVAISKGNHT